MFKRVFFSTQIIFCPSICGQMMLHSVSNHAIHVCLCHNLIWNPQTICTFGEIHWAIKIADTDDLTHSPKTFRYCRGVNATVIPATLQVVLQTSTTCPAVVPIVHLLQPLHHLLRSAPATTDSLHTPVTLKTTTLVLIACRILTRKKRLLILILKHKKFCATITSHIVQWDREIDSPAILAIPLLPHTPTESHFHTHTAAVQEQQMSKHRPTRNCHMLMSVLLLILD